MQKKNKKKQKKKKIAEASWRFNFITCTPYRYCSTFAASVATDYINDVVDDDDDDATYCLYIYLYLCCNFYVDVGLLTKI